MKPTFIKTQHAEYERETWNGEAAPIKPIGNTVLVLTDRVKEKTSGLIVIPQEIADKLNVGAESGVIVALGKDAFREYDDEDRPKIGDHVCFTRYSGQVVYRDKRLFRLMSDETIGGIELDVDRLDIGQG